MSEQQTQVPPVRGRAGYAGFRATIKAVATGPRGSRDLTFDEARDAGAALLAAEVTPVQAGAFLIGMRVKGEAAEEIAGLTQALRDAATPLRAPSGMDVVVCAGAFDGLADAPPLGLAAAICASAAGGDGLGVAVPCGARLGPKLGITPADVLEALGGPARPLPEASEAMLARSGVAVVHASTALPGWDDLARVRGEVGLRGPIHSAEKLLDWFGATRFVVGHTHGAFGSKLIAALEHLGASSAYAVRGIEGSFVLRPGRPVAVGSTGPVELPDALGVTLRGDPDPGLTAGLTRAVLAGEETGAARRAVALSAAVALLAGGRARDGLQAIALAERALDDGRAAATLDALVE